MFADDDWTDPRVLCKVVKGTCSIDDLEPGFLSFLTKDRWKDSLPADKDAYVLTTPRLRPGLPDGNKYILTEEPLVVFAEVHDILHHKEPDCIAPLVGVGCDLHETAVIGGQGFHSFRRPGGHAGLLKHIGGVRLGAHVRIGAHTCVDRGLFHDTVIDDRAKLDNLVQVGHQARVGRDVVVCAGAILGGSCVVRDCSFIGLGAIIRPHVTVGVGALVGMGAVVTKDVPPGEVVAGNPAKIIRSVKEGEI